MEVLVDLHALRFCSDGRLVQMVGVGKWYGVLIYHAMTPPTASVLAEFRLTGR